MRTIIGIFLASCVLSMILTPLVIRVARYFNLMDKPSARKVHLVPIPRIGGVAIFLAFFLGYLPCFFYETGITAAIYEEPRILWLGAGAVVVFGLGLIDDIWRLGYMAKFSVQIIAGIIAYSGGLRIEFISFLPQHVLAQTGISFFVTVFWVVLVINAVNLIDGLDGLAAGVSFLVCVVLIFLCSLGQRFVPASILSSLAGALLGFLLFNTSPASIFMGDSGSYLIGFVLASISMMGSFKGQTAASILIPMIALGFPLMDTLWSTLRRFIFGRKLFSPDRDHIHHRLMAMGLTQQRVVLILYGITVLMGCLSIIMVYTNDDKTAFLLLLFAAGITIGMQQLGYFDFFRGNSLLHWLRDVSDETGISLERRSFLNFQMAIQHSKNLDDMWDSLCKAAQWLKFDLVELRMESVNDRHSKFFWWNIQRQDDSDEDWNAFLQRETLMKLELPLTSIDAQKFNKKRTSNSRTTINDRGKYGTLWLVKDLKRDPLSHYTIRRIEHLRRTVIKTIEKIDKENP